MGLRGDYIAKLSKEEIEERLFPFKERIEDVLKTPLRGTSSRSPAFDARALLAKEIAASIGTINACRMVEINPMTFGNWKKWRGRQMAKEQDKALLHPMRKPTVEGTGEDLVPGRDKQQPFLKSFSFPVGAKKEEPLMTEDLPLEKKPGKICMIFAEGDSVQTALSAMKAFLNN